MLDQVSPAALACFGGLAVVTVLLLVFFTLPLIASIIASLFGTPLLKNSALYIGNVWHTRLHPKRHSFTYPIFMFALDLEELDDFHRTIWPLSIWVAKFREMDHMKNGEGLYQKSGMSDQSSETDNKEQKNREDDGSNSIAHRILRLVAEKTRNKFNPKLESYRVMILTHLCYYGYNFNPVSFYYVIDRQTNEIAAVVGEVSNTPWTEMYCYVLHPDSIDKVKTKAHSNDRGDFKKVEYSFPKEFHVSPFMEMDYWYDWTFVGVPVAPVAAGDGATTSSNPITVVNTLRKRGNDRIDFTAKLIMESHSIAPFQIFWQMIKLPVFCMIIQIWIHYQAALLFMKGVVYIPHPEESETTASRIIATIMIPFFKIRDFLNPKSKTA